MRVPLEKEDVLEDPVGARERFVRVAEQERDSLVDVPFLAVIVDARRGVVVRLLRRRAGRQDLVVDVDEIERVEHGRFVPCYDGGDRIAHEAHAVAAERVFVLGDGEDPERDRKVAAGENEQHSGMPLGLRRVDRPDDGVRDLGAQQLAVDGAREDDVVGEARLARHLAAAVHAAARFPDCVARRPGAAHRGSRRRAAASSTASKIWLYPVHRQRLPERASATSSRVGLGFFSSRTCAVSRIPGVQ